MSQVTREAAKGYFNTGDKPTEQQFANLIDSAKWYDEEGGALDFVTATDIEITDHEKGIIMYSSNGTKYRITIDNAGKRVVTVVSPGDNSPQESYPFADSSAYFSDGGINGTTGAGSVIGTVANQTIVKVQIFVENAADLYGSGAALNFIHLTVRENNKTGTILAEKSVTSLGIPATGPRSRLVDVTLDSPLVIEGSKILYIDYYCDMWSKEFVKPENLYSGNTPVMYSSQLNTDPRGQQIPTSPAQLTLWTKLYFQTVGETIEDEAAADILLPTVMDAVVGKEFNLYIDSFIGSDFPVSNYKVAFTSTVGKSSLVGYSYTPSAPETFTVAVEVWYGAQLVKNKTITVNARANSGTVRKVLVHGDSNFEQPGLDMKKTIVTENASAFTFVGERTKDDDGTLIKHEATYGWSLGQYLAEGDMNTYYKATVTGLTMQTYALLYTGSAQFQLVRKVLDGSGNGYVILLKYNNQALPSSGTLTKSSGHAGDASFAYTGGTLVSGNPFWNSGALNIGAYLTRNSITLGSSDVWLVHLGTNGLQFHTSDADDDAFAEGFVSQMITLRNAIRAASSTVNILIALTIPCCSLPHALQPNNGIVRYKKAWRKLLKAVLTEFDKSTYITDKVKVIPLNAGLDPIYGFQNAVSAVSARDSATTLKSTDAIHMGASGQQQAADVVLAALRGVS